MSLDAVKAMVKALLDSIPGMGRTYPYEVHASQASDIRALCAINGIINFWTIARERTPENRLASRANERHYGLVIRGYYSLGEHGASEEVFEALVESICTVFRDKPALQGAAETSEPVQVDRPDPHRYLGEVLCHYAELRLSVQELINW